MNVWRLAIREMRYRKLSAALGLVGVTTAIAVLVGTFLLLEASGNRTMALLRQREAVLSADMAALDNEVRKAMLALGFTVTILPAREDLTQYHANGAATHSMPEEHAARLANSGTLTVRHMVPLLRRRIKWAETRWTIILTGTPDHVLLPDSAAQELTTRQVAPGQIVLGYELHRGLKLAEGRTVALLGKEFTVGDCLRERGTRDDITAWVTLREAQSLLDAEGRISEIRALRCRTDTIDMSELRAELQRVLPGTQALSSVPEALAGVMARAGAARQVEAAAQREREKQVTTQRHRRQLALVSVGLAVTCCSALLGLLALANVRRRTSEIGILRSLGLCASQIFVLVLLRWVTIGLAGAIAGFGVGLAVAYGSAAGSSGNLASVFPWQRTAVLFLAGVAAALGATTLAGWFPAVLAVRQDPAAILQQE